MALWFIVDNDHLLAARSQFLSNVAQYSLSFTADLQIGDVELFPLLRVLL